MARDVYRVPDSLYNHSLSIFITHIKHHENELPSLPRNILFDASCKMYKRRQLEDLESLFSDLKTFVALLGINNKPYILHHCYQALIDRNYSFIENIASTYKHLATHALTSNSKVDRDAAIQIALKLGTFLSDGGWYQQSETILENCLLLCKNVESEHQVPLYFKCYQRLLCVRNCFCKFDVAEQTYKEALALLEQIPANERQHCNLAGLYEEFANFFCSQHNYVEAYKWSAEALKELETCESIGVRIAVVGQASMICVMKREYEQAGLLAKGALRLAKLYYGIKHPIMANCLIDCAFYLINIDRAGQAAKSYRSALRIRRKIFGDHNLRVAHAHQHLAFALYVHEYNSGNFAEAKEHCEKAMQIMVKLLPENHLYIISLKSIKAHILEEIAIASQDETVKKNLLLECQNLYEAALPSMQEKYGEVNLQTAKHYSGLGRLYQSMDRCQEAEVMHLKAIEIKEKLLCPDDYEIALSLGYLASLYNYNMKKYDEAEPLYLRSINITLNVFGMSSNGLRIEFEGLINLYTALGDDEKVNKYREMLSLWKRLKSEAMDEDAVMAVDPEVPALV